MVDVDITTIRDIATTVAAIVGTVKILIELNEKWQNKKRSQPRKQRKRK